MFNPTIFAPTKYILIVSGPELILNIFREAEVGLTFLELEDEYEMLDSPTKIVFKFSVMSDSTIPQVAYKSLTYPELEFMLIYWNLSQEVYGYYWVCGKSEKTFHSTLFHNTDYVTCQTVCQPIGTFQTLLKGYGFEKECL